MKPIVIPCDRDKDPERWHEIRRSGIGGSDIAAICGLSPWRGPLAIYLEKLGQSIDREPTEAMEWGNILEDVIAKEFSKRTGVKIRRTNTILRHPRYKFMLANIDRWAEEDGKRGVLEVKNVGRYSADDWADGQVPDYYMVQIQWYLEITDTDWGYLAPLIGGNRLSPVRIERDDRLIQTLIKSGADFWKHVEERTPPLIDGSENSEKVLRYLFPTAIGGSRKTMDQQHQKIYADWIAARAARKTAEEEERLYANQLIAWLGDQESGFLPGGTRPAFTYKGVETRRLDTKALAAAHPDIVADYYVTTSTRRLCVGKEE